MFNFLQLSGLLLTRPQSVRAKIDELQLLFINAHHRLNRYRELQAADSIVGYLEQQTERRRKVAEDLRAHLAARLVFVFCFSLIVIKINSVSCIKKTCETISTNKSKKTVADALSALQEGRSDAEETVATLRQAMASAQGAADVSVSNGAQSRGMDEANAVDEDSSNDDVGQAGLTTVLVADGAEESTFSAPGALPSAVEMPEDSDVGDQATQASRSTAETEEKVFFIRQSATDLQKLLEETK